MKEIILQQGYVILENVFTNEEVDNIVDTISLADSSNEVFRKSNDLFAIRQFFKDVPAISNLVFNKPLLNIITDVMGDDYFVVKSIYFDKPETSNWFVSYHQDLTISVNKKIEVAGYGPWTKKQNQYAVQPPVAILKDNFTIRVHLDNTNEENGALKVIASSHLKGIYRPETIDWNKETETICNVKKGGIMIMKPLLLHSSGRTINKNRRRVIHIEFSRSKLPHCFYWSEFLPTNKIS